MATMKAPFNFVPLSDEVFFPDWANDISHDIPFKDGISGSIELKITAESPIFVRNGHTKEEAEKKTQEFKDFSNIDGIYFIPSTTIKGTIRNVLEIISFSKMQQVSNKKYSIRDLQLPKYLAFFQNSNIHCGWMRKEGEEKVIITDCGIPRRISHKDLDENFGTTFCEKFANPVTFKKDDNKTAKFKYEQIGKAKLTSKFEELQLNKENAVDKRIRVRFDSHGKEGTIVFTGQSGIRKEKVLNYDKTIRQKASGKFYEFVFMNEALGTFELDTYDKEGIYNDFLFVYKDSKDWEFWRGKMRKGESVPVFFYKNDSGELEHVGLSYLYKLPSKKRIKEYLPQEHSLNSLDFSECIFGTTSNNKLKGRAWFSHAMTDQKATNKELRVYMGSPKPSYYPIYLKQDGEGGYMEKDGKSVLFKTMLHDTSVILKGWKRYPIRNNWDRVLSIPEGQDENANPFIPMPTGSVFSSILRFHNLKRVELGGLLEAILLPDGHSHTMGFAKAYGYGRVKIEIGKVKGVNSNDIQTFKDEFKQLLSNQIKDFKKSAQKQEFLDMSKPQDLVIPLEYMELDDFVACKRQNKSKNNPKTGEYLQYYSELIKKEEKSKITREKSEVEATVAVFNRFAKQVRFEGDKNRYPLDMNKKSTKLKIGEVIIVEKQVKNGKVERVTFKRKA